MENDDSGVLHIDDLDDEEMDSVSHGRRIAIIPMLLLLLLSLLLFVVVVIVVVVV